MSYQTEIWSNFLNVLVGSGSEIDGFLCISV